MLCNRKREMRLRRKPRFKWIFKSTEKNPCRQNDKLKFWQIFQKYFTVHNFYTNFDDIFDVHIACFWNDMFWLQNICDNTGGLEYIMTRKKMMQKVFKNWLFFVQSIVRMEIKPYVLCMQTMPKCSKIF